MEREMFIAFQDDILLRNTPFCLVFVILIGYLKSFKAILSLQPIFIRVFGKGTEFACTKVKTKNKINQLIMKGGKYYGKHYKNN